MSTRCTINNCTMSQHVFITYTDPLKQVADAIGNHIFFNAKMRLESRDMSADELYRLAQMSATEFFYVINSNVEINIPTFDFSYKPPEWDKMFVHIWDNNTNIKLFNRELVLADPSKYSDDQMLAGNVMIKILDEKISMHVPLDIIFISFDEKTADNNYAALKKRFPRAKRVHNIPGIYEAHKAAARLANSRMFYVVDADAEIESTFNFDYRPDGYNEDSTHVWYSRNPVNDLVYGYGGIKLFPRQRVLDYVGAPTDFTTTVSPHFKVMPEISNVTKFNVDPFSAWRSGFRECTKLAAKLIPNGVDIETEERLAAWCEKGHDREFGKFAIDGARAGTAFGTAHKDQPDMLGLINNYAWLESKFIG